MTRLAAIGSRQGDADRRTAQGWSSAAIGTCHQGEVNQVTVPAHSYRLVTTGQPSPPLRSPLLAEEAGGIAHADVVVPPTPRTWRTPANPDSKPLGVVLPTFGRGSLHLVTPARPLPTLRRRYAPRSAPIASRAGGRAPRRAPQSGETQSRSARFSMARRRSPETWTWAESLMTHSTRVRASVRAELANAERRRPTVAVSRTRRGNHGGICARTPSRTSPKP